MVGRTHRPTERTGSKGLQAKHPLDGDQFKGGGNHGKVEGEIRGSKGNRPNGLIRYHSFWRVRERTKMQTMLADKWGRGEGGEGLRRHLGAKTRFEGVSEWASGSGYNLKQHNAPKLAVPYTAVAQSTYWGELESNGKQIGGNLRISSQGQQQYNSS